MRHGHRLGLRSITTSTSTSTSVSASFSSKSQKKMVQCLLLLGAASACGTSYAIQEQEQEQENMKINTIMNMNMNTIMNMNMNNHTSITQCAALRKTGGDVVMLGPTEERATGILFPNLCNAMTFVGCGVRVKYGFVKVYAVGTYMDPIAMSAVKSSSPQEIQKALLDPTYPRTIRIVMNRGLSIEKYTAAIVEALGPRMNGQDIEKLEEFKKLNPPVDLVEGAVMEMTIRGNFMLYKNALGGVGQIDSRAFCEALCDVYYGDDPVSPGHKEDVIKGVRKL